jgi:hypothetical protein
MLRRTFSLTDKEKHLPHVFEPDLLVCNPLIPGGVTDVVANEERKGRTKRATASQPLSISSEQPTMPQLLKINLPVRVRDKYEVFGIHLLNDDYGDKMVILRERFLRDAEKITMEVLVEWLRGRGVGVSWQSLITTLWDSELFLMADQLQTALEQLLHHNKSKKGKLA